ncbi:MAG: glutamine--fructose-6-phosphate transaminase (isomerizing), partial [Eubacteriales bacterium]
DSLSKLEYRGYDSAGIAYNSAGDLNIVKTKGRLKDLDEIVSISEPTEGGIGHTRWATHGEPSYVNSHPHTNNAGDIAVVHNGIIENFSKLKEWLESKGVSFLSETDTEVVAHLVNHFYAGSLFAAVQEAVKMIEGSYALGVISPKHPNEVIAVKKDSPLIIGVGEDENFIASDIPAILEYTRNIYLLEDGEIAILTQKGVEIFDEYGVKVDREIFTVDWDVSAAQKGGYEHFMIKEIHEQPKAVKDTLMPRIKDGHISIEEMEITEEMVKNIRKIHMVACGTAYHSGMIGKYIIERMARIPVEATVASEFRYMDPILNPEDWMIVVSQSGETADTIAAIREAQKQGITVVAITNVLGSTISRIADKVIYTHAGPEIAVASTKAHVTQVLCLYMLCLELALKGKKITEDEYTVHLNELIALPEKIEVLLDKKDIIQKIAYKQFNQPSVFFLGRGLDYALSMEASLKLKEVSYIHSEAYAAGELKHGTIALIEDNTLVVANCTQSEVYEKTISNVKEVKARGAYVIGVAYEGQTDAAKHMDDVIYLPQASDFVAPMLAIVPLQLFAYYMSVEKGCDVDKPRNLAKSVTVE